MKLYTILLFTLIFTSCSSVLNKKTGFLDSTQGTKIQFIERNFGKSTPIILVHGGPGMPGYMASIANRLRDFHTVQYYQRDVTNSPSNGPFTVQSFSGDLYHVVKYIKLKTSQKPIVLGHSWGASLILDFLKNYPGTVQKAVLISPGTLTKEQGAEFGERIFSRLGANRKLAEQKYKELIETKDPSEYAKRLKKYLKIIGPAYFYDAERSLRGELDNLKLKSNPKDSDSIKEINKDYWNRISNGKMLDGFSKIKELVIHIQPDFDINSPKKAKAALSSIENYKYVEIRNAGHFPWLEKELQKSFMQTLIKHLR